MGAGASVSSTTAAAASLVRRGSCPPARASDRDLATLRMHMQTTDSEAVAAAGMRGCDRHAPADASACAVALEPPPDWSDLPEVLLVAIADRLASGADAGRFALVCKTYLRALRAGSVWPVPGPRDPATGLRQLLPPPSGRFHRVIEPGSDAMDLQRALDSLPPHATVRLAPGEHKGCVTIARKINVFGFGLATLTPAAGRGSTALMEVIRVSSAAARATLDGVRILGTPSEGPGAPRPLPNLFPFGAPAATGVDGVFIGAGSIRLQNCEIRVPLGRLGVAIYGPSSDPVVLNCRIHGGIHGVVVNYGGGGQIAGCHVSHAGAGGIVVRGGNSAPVIWSNMVSNCGAGIIIGDDVSRLVDGRMGGPATLGAGGPRGSRGGRCVVVGNTIEHMQSGGATAAAAGLDGDYGGEDEDAGGELEDGADGY